MIGLTIGLIGLIVYFRPTRLNICMLWISVFSAVITVGYATIDAYIYLIPAFLCFAVWIGVGLGKLTDSISKRFHNVGGFIGLILIPFLLLNAWGQRAQVDASNDLQAESFGKSVLSLAPTNALVMANGDKAVFTMWYFHYALQKRPDLIIIATDLIQFEWYIQTLHIAYPDLDLPGPLPFPETVVAANPDRTICRVQYTQVPEINCLPTRTSHLP